MLVGLPRGFTAFYASRVQSRTLSKRPTKPVVRKVVVPSSSGGNNNNLGDEMLDFLYAGKKLRKWYGQEGPVLPRDGDSQQEEIDESVDADNSPRDGILVLDSDTNPMAEQVLLQLILARANIKAIVRDVTAAKMGYGPYIQATGGDSSDPNVVRTVALNKVMTIVLCGQVFPSVIKAAARAGVQHAVLLSAVGLPKQGGFQLFRNSEMDVLKEEKREDIIKSSGMKYTIIRINGFLNEQGGQSALKPAPIVKIPKTPLAREDAAIVVAQAALRDVTSQESLEFGIENAGPGQPPSDWPAFFQEIASLCSTK